MATSTLHNEQEEHPCSRMTAFVIRNCPRNDEPELWGITNSWVPGKDITGRCRIQYTCLFLCMLYCYNLIVAVFVVVVVVGGGGGGGGGVVAACLETKHHNIDVIVKAKNITRDAAGKRLNILRHRACEVLFGAGYVWPPHRVAVTGRCEREVSSPSKRCGHGAREESITIDRSLYSRLTDSAAQHVCNIILCIYNKLRYLNPQLLLAVNIYERVHQWWRPMPARQR